LEINKEVLKGHIDTILLSLLFDSPMYGYELAKSTRDRSGGTFELKEGTMYLALKRLEQQGMIESFWGDEEGSGGGRRKYYRMTQAGEAHYGQKCKEWALVKSIMDTFIHREDD